MDMTTSTTMTIRLDPKLKKSLGDWRTVQGVADPSLPQRRWKPTWIVNWQSSRALNAVLQIWKLGERSAMRTRWQLCGARLRLRQAGQREATRSLVHRGVERSCRSSYLHRH